MLKKEVYLSLIGYFYTLVLFNFFYPLFLAFDKRLLYILRFEFILFLWLVLTFDWGISVVL